MGGIGMSGSGGGGGGPNGGCSPDDSFVSKFQNLEEVVGQVMLVAQDQNGCRFLQRKFDEGGPAVSGTNEMCETLSEMSEMSGTPE